MKNYRFLLEAIKRWRKYRYVLEVTEVLQVTFFLRKFVGTVFVGIAFVSSIILSDLITQSSATLAKYLPLF